MAGLHWLPRTWLSSQVQSTLCVMNDIETYPWQPAGPSPDLCKHQPEAALVLRQAGDSPSQPRCFWPPAWDASYLSSCVSAPDTGGWILCGFPSEDLGRKCHSLSSLCLSLFALAENRLWSSLLRSHLWSGMLSPAAYLLSSETWTASTALIGMTGGCVRSFEGSLDEQSWVLKLISPVLPSWVTVKQSREENLYQWNV